MSLLVSTIRDIANGYPRLFERFFISSDRNKQSINCHTNFLVSQNMFSAKVKPSAKLIQTTLLGNKNRSLKFKKPDLSPIQIFYFLVNSTKILRKIKFFTYDVPSCQVQQKKREFYLKNKCTLLRSVQVKRKSVRCQSDSTLNRILKAINFILI